jgi:hypothetical protein
MPIGEHAAPSCTEPTFGGHWSELEVGHIPFSVVVAHTPFEHVAIVLHVQRGSLPYSH